MKILFTTPKCVQHFVSLLPVLVLAISSRHALSQGDGVMNITKYLSQIHTLKFVATAEVRKFGDSKVAETTVTLVLIDLDRRYARFERMDDAGAGTERIVTDSKTIFVGGSDDSLAVTYRSGNHTEDWEHVVGRSLNSIPIGYFPPLSGNAYLPRIQEVKWSKAGSKSWSFSREHDSIKMVLRSDGSGAVQSLSFESATDDPQGFSEYSYNVLEWDAELSFPKSFRVTTTKPGGEFNVEIPKGLGFTLPPQKVQQMRFETVVTLSELRLNEPIAVGEFVVQRNIPEGYPVLIPDISHIPHEWRDGEVCPVADPEITTIALQARFQKPIPEPGVRIDYLTIGLILLGCLVVGIVLWKVFISWRSKQ